MNFFVSSSKKITAGWAYHQSGGNSNGNHSNGGNHPGRHPLTGEHQWPPAGAAQQYQQNQQQQQQQFPVDSTGEPADTGSLERGFKVRGKNLINLPPLLHNSNCFFLSAARQARPEPLQQPFQRHWPSDAQLAGASTWANESCRRRSCCCSLFI